MRQGFAHGVTVPSLRPATCNSAHFQKRSRESVLATETEACEDVDADPRGQGSVCFGHTSGCVPEMMRVCRWFTNRQTDRHDSTESGSPESHFNRNYKKVPFAFGDQLLTRRDGTLLCSAGPEWYGYLGIVDTEASTWAPAVGRPSKSAGCLAAQKERKKKKATWTRRKLQTKVHCFNRRANSYARTALTKSLSQEEPVVFLCQARNVRQNRPRCHLHPCLHRSIQTLQFSNCAICRHQEKKVRPLPKFGEHKKSTPRSIWFMM